MDNNTLVVIYENVIGVIKGVNVYPMKFTKVFKEKVWGGRQFNDVLNMNLPDVKSYGESWEVCSHKNGMSIVENGYLKGKTLEDLINTNGKKLLGEEIVQKYSNKFPLLIKYLDINDKLSVQVHPNDDYALRVEGEFGKYESWYVVDASEDAKIILGIKDGVSRDQFESKVRNEDFSDIFREVKVKKGDIIDVVPGLVHASLEGSIMICEIQQNSDTTYRIYDFDRAVDGQKRELHIDKSLEVIDFSITPSITSQESRERVELQKGFKEKLSSNDYYNIDRIKLNGGEYRPESYKNFKIHSVIGGSGIAEYNKESLTLSKGDTFLIPANLDVSIVGDIEILESYI